MASDLLHCYVKVIFNVAISPTTLLVLHILKTGVDRLVWVSVEELVLSFHKRDLYQVVGFLNHGNVT